MVDVMVGDEDRVHLADLHAGPGHLVDGPATGVEEQEVLADLDHGGALKALRVRRRSAGSQECHLDRHDATGYQLAGALRNRWSSPRMRQSRTAKCLSKMI